MIKAALLFFFDIIIGIIIGIFIAVPHLLIGGAILTLTELIFVKNEEDRKEGSVGSALLSIPVIIIYLIWFRNDPYIFDKAFYQNHWIVIFGVFLGLISIAWCIFESLRIIYNSFIYREANSKSFLETSIERVLDLLLVLNLGYLRNISSWIKKSQYYFLVSFLITLFSLISVIFLLSISLNRIVVNHEIKNWYYVQTPFIGFTIYVFIVYILTMIDNISEDIKNKKNKLFIYYLFRFPKTLRFIWFRDFELLITIMFWGFFTFFWAFIFVASLHEALSEEYPTLISRGGHIQTFYFNSVLEDELFSKPEYKYYVIDDYETLKSDYEKYESCDEGIGNCGEFENNIIAIYNDNNDLKILICDGCKDSIYLNEDNTKTYKDKIIVQMYSNYIKGDTNDINQIDKLFLSQVKYMKHIFYKKFNTYKILLMFWLWPIIFLGVAHSIINGYLYKKIKLYED